MLKIRRPLGRLIFNMGIAIPGKTVFLIETAPLSPVNYQQIVVYVAGYPGYVITPVISTYTNMFCIFISIDATHFIMSVIDNILFWAGYLIQLPLSQSLTGAEEVPWTI